MYEDIKYGGFYTITGKSKRYIYISGTELHTFIEHIGCTLKKRYTE